MEKQQRAVHLPLIDAHTLLAVVGYLRVAQDRDDDTALQPVTCFIEQARDSRDVKLRLERLFVAADFLALPRLVRLAARVAAQRVQHWSSLGKVPSPVLPVLLSELNVPGLCQAEKVLRVEGRYAEFRVDVLKAWTVLAARKLHRTDEEWTEEAVRAVRAELIRRHLQRAVARLVSDAADEVATQRVAALFEALGGEVLRFQLPTAVPLPPPVLQRLVASLVHVTKLDLSGAGLQPTESVETNPIPALFKGLSELPVSVARLDVGSTAITGRGMAALVSKLSTASSATPRLPKIQQHRSRVSSWRSKPAPGPEEVHDLTLVLRDNDLRDIGLVSHALPHAGVRWDKLTHLDVSHNALGVAGGQALAELLSAPSCMLTHLTTADAQLGPTGLGVLANAVARRNNSLLLLNVADNLDEADSLVAQCQPLAGFFLSESLQTLVLSGNAFARSTCLSMFAAMKRANRQLRRLELDRVPAILASEAPSTSAANAARVSKRRELWLQAPSANSPRPAGKSSGGSQRLLAVLVSAVRSHPELRRLSLAGIVASSDDSGSVMGSAAALLATCVRNPRIEFLDVSGNGLSTLAVRDWALQLEPSYLTLRHLNLSSFAPSGVRMRDEGLHALLGLGLEANRTLEFLGVDAHGLRDESCETLAKFLPGMSRLRFVSMRGNYCSSRFALALMHAFPAEQPFRCFCSLARQAVIAEHVNPERVVQGGKYGVHGGEQAEDEIFFAPDSDDCRLRLERRWRNLRSRSYSYRYSPGLRWNLKLRVPHAVYICLEGNPCLSD